MRETQAYRRGLNLSDDQFLSLALDVRSRWSEQRCMLEKQDERQQGPQQLA